MLDKFPQPDRYIKLLAMFGYTFNDYARDVSDELIDLNYPYIIVHLGTLQIGLFEAVKNYEMVLKLGAEISAVNSCAHLVISGLLLRPMDYPQSRCRCEMYNTSFKMVVQEIRRKKSANIGFMDPFLEFINFGWKNRSRRKELL